MTVQRDTTTLHCGPCLKVRSDATPLLGGDLIPYLRWLRWRAASRMLAVFLEPDNAISRTFGAQKRRPQLPRFGSTASIRTTQRNCDELVA